MEHDHYPTWPLGVLQQVGLGKGALPHMKLIEIGETGTLPEDIVTDDFLREVVEATVAHYQRTGFVPPWTGYVA